MIPNISNKQVFDSEFDLSSSPLIYSNPLQNLRYYKVSRNSDLLEYSLALLEIKDPSQYNFFLQNILAFIPITKAHPSFLELHTLYAWEINKPNLVKSLNIAILMDKFDAMLSNQKISSENEAFELLGNTLKACNALQQASVSLNFQSLCVRNRVVKIIELGWNKDCDKDFLLLEPNQNHFLQSLSHFFEESLRKNSMEKINENPIKDEKIKENTLNDDKKEENLLKKSSVKDHNIKENIEDLKLKKLLKSMKETDVNISSILEDYFQSSDPILQKSSEAFIYAPICRFHHKICLYICKNEECKSLLCEECMKTHKKTHWKSLIEYREFLKGEIAQGGSIKVLEGLIARITEVSGLLEKKYAKNFSDIYSLFTFLENQFSKVLRMKKTIFLEYLNGCKNDDNERLLIIEKQLLLHKKELQKLQETNEWRAPYLPDDIQRMLPFLGEIISNFQPRFLEKITELKLEALENSTDSMITKLQKAPLLLEMNQLTRKFSEILEKLCVKNPVLNDLEVEKLQTSFIEIKPIILAKPMKNQPVNSLLFLEDTKNQFIASYNFGEIIRTWDSANFAENFEKKAFTFKEKSGFQPKRLYKEKEIALGIDSLGSSLVIYDYKTAENAGCLKEKAHGEDFIHSFNTKNSVFSLEIYPKDSLVLLGCAKDLIQILSLETFKLQKQISPVSEPVENLGNVLVLEKLFHDKKKLFLAGNSASFLRIWDLETFSLVRSFKIQQNLTVSVLLPLEKSRIVLGTIEGTIQVWDPMKGTLLRALDYSHHEAVTAFAISHKLQLLISSGRDSRLILWDLEKFYAKKLVLVMGEAQNPCFLSLSWANSNELLACGSENGGVYLLDLGWELKKFEDMTRNLRQRSCFSKQSSDLTDFFFGEEEKGTKSFRGAPWDVAGI